MWSVPPEVDTSGEVQIEEFDGTWVIDAPWLQRLIANVNFGDYESRNWFDQKLRQSGLFDKLEEMGIKDGDIVDKKILVLPREIHNVIKCRNPRCITSIEQGLPHIFVLADEEKKSTAVNTVKRRPATPLPGKQSAVF